ncbi:MAG: MBL fold metallo-hydrolase [Clostridiales bacterium]|nr:MBL fold metallo-hydrolase [Clostridiales bacterium]MCF8023840.1 MBL fold metallo-hydrolase [Clostridiales bacterium]
MKIEWLGHASFLITKSDNMKIVTDPFDETVGYPIPKVKPDIVTISHQHFDHNAVDKLPCDPIVIQEVGGYSAGKITIKGIHSYHDPEQGAQRGENIIFVIETEGLKVCHLGDLGHDLEQEHLDKLKDIDVLLVPVGGNFTIDASQAQKIVSQLQPKYVVPMHYKTNYIEIPISTPDEFLNNYDFQLQDELNIDPKKMPDSTQVVQLKLKQEKDEESTEESS